MTLADFSREQLCVADLRGRDAAGILFELSLVLDRGGVVPDALSFFTAAMDRYFLSDADVLPGVAFPAGRLDSIAATTFALGRSSEPIHWRHGFAPVRLVFLLAAPCAASSNYAALLTALQRLVRDEQIPAALHVATDPAAMLEPLRRFSICESEQLPPVNADPEFRDHWSAVQLPLAHPRR